MRYLPWLILPTLALVIALAFAVKRAERPRTFAGADATQLVRDKKIRRTGTNFSDGAAERTPLHEVNREALDISLNIDPRTWELMRLKSNRRTYRNRAVAASVSFADREPAAAMLRLRGGGSLADPERPNFRISMVQSESFAPNLKLDVIYLMNLRYDIPQVKTVFSYRLLASLGLFHPHVQFVRVRVNGEPMGMFLLIEPPTSAVRRTQNDVVAVYRRSDVNRYLPQWSKAVASAGDTLRDFVSLCFNSARPSDPSAELDRVVNLDQLFSWMCVNALLANDDTLDELYLFEQRPNASRPGRLGVMAWDYDDILETSSTSEDPLIHRVQGAVEMKIHRSPELYTRMRERYARLLASELSADRVVAILRDVQRLRDSLDDGKPERQQSAERTARAARVTEYERLIRARHAQLLAAVNADPTTSPSSPPAP